MLKKLNNFLQKNKPLVVIILLATALRFVFPNIPPSLNWDEISHGYNAYSILKTGRDEWGVAIPAIFRAYGDYKLPVYVYITAVSELLFGLTTFAVRLPSILAGIGTVIFSYLLSGILFSKNKNSRKISVISALLVSIEPWSFFLSRAAFEANLALFLFLAGLYFLIKFVHSKKAGELTISAGLLGLSVWTYNSYRIFTPLMIVSVIIIYRNSFIELYQSSKRSAYLVLMILTIFFLPMFYQLFSSVGQARYSWVQILDQGMLVRIDEARGKGGSRLLHNKLTYFSVGFAKNYISHFSSGFLFLNGGSNYQFSLPGQGILYLTDLPFILIGLLFLIRHLIKKEKWAFLILSWILFAPIPSSLTREAPHVLRSITFIPIPMMISAFGLSGIFSVVTGNTRIFLTSSYVLLLLLLGYRYLEVYFRDYPIKYSQSWQFGYQNASEYVSKNYANYDKIVMTKKYGEPHEFLLFYLEWPPDKYVNDPKLKRFFQTNWYWVDGFDKFYFVNDWQILDKSTGNYTFKQESGGLVQCTPRLFRCLLITSPGNVPDGWKRIQDINFLNGTPAFELYEN